VVIPKNGKEFDPNEGKKPDLTAADLRFTTKGPALYVFVQGWPQENSVLIRSLGSRSPHAVKVHHASILGHGQKLHFTQQPDGLRVILPSSKAATADIGFTLKLVTA
jgi:alpha-L-fucosidase